MIDSLLTAVVSVVAFLTAWIYNRRHDDAAELQEEVDDLREKLKTVTEERDGWKETAESTDKLLRIATERADRLASMNDGLAKDLAALKAYNPDEIEERLKKIQEIKADEERKKAEAQRENLIIAMMQTQFLSQQYGGGFGMISPMQSWYASPMSMRGR